MQRPIKFRAWAISSKIMYSPEQICRLHFTDGAIYGMLTWEEDMCMGDSFILMQFTGCHDRHGKEIYEGDVTDLGEVKWSKGDTAWVVGDWLLGTKVGLEVIGNIYEHSHLLGDKNPEPLIDG